MSKICQDMSLKSIFSFVPVASSATICLLQPLTAGTLGALTYVDNGNSISITHCTQTATGAIEIPATINDKPVTDIGTGAFSRCTWVTSVTIPVGVTSIADRAFFYCYGLTAMTIPATVVSIGGEAFFYCDGLTSLTLANGVTSIGDSAFQLCTGLQSVTLPASVARIGAHAFVTCSKLQRATFLGNAPAMGADVFTETKAKLYYYEGRTGFTSPTWHGYPTVKLGPEISIQQPTGSDLVDGKSRKSFGTIKIGRPGAARTFTIRNGGMLTLSGLAITTNGAHARDFLVSTPAQTSLAPGTATTFKVTFKPTYKGTRNAAIHIRSNDRNENPFDISVTGTGATN